MLPGTTVKDINYEQTNENQGLSFCARFEMYAREIANILPCNFATFPLCFPPKICIDIVENHFLHVTISFLF